MFWHFLFSTSPAGTRPSVTLVDGAFFSLFLLSRFLINHGFMICGVSRLFTWALRVVPSSMSACACGVHLELLSQAKWRSYYLFKPWSLLQLYIPPFLVHRVNVSSQMLYNTFGSRTSVSNTSKCIFVLHHWLCIFGQLIISLCFA